VTVRLDPVRREDVDALCRMDVREDQVGFVAHNAMSLAEQPYETGAHPFVIRDGDVAVGFLMVIDCREHAYREDGDPTDAAYLWRFMIDADHQGRGHGRAALTALGEWCRARDLRRIVTSAVERNAQAHALYEAIGLARTGRVVDGEVEFAGPA